MKKRYVVFVSSTYEDLIDERQAVSKALLRSNCFPSQMENWPAMDAEQMKAIRQLIEECDYYVVLAAGKYGSIDPDSGLSYTELEYDYALKIGKPTIRLVHRDPFNQLRGDQIELAGKKRRLLQSFHTKLKTGSVCSFWSSPEELMIETILALQDIITRHPTDGWVRSETVAAAQDQEREAKLINELVKNFRAQEDGELGRLTDLPVPVIRLTRDCKLTFVNEEATRLLGVERAKGRKLDDYFDGLGRSIKDWVLKFANGSTESPSQFLRGTGDNQDKFVQANLSMTSENGSEEILAILSDVTELKTLEAQFVQLQKMQAIGQLAGGVAHDFNNLLTAISGHCDLLLLRNDATDRDYADLVQIHQNANRAASVVGQLLAFSRKQTLHATALDIRDTISDLAQLLGRLVGEKVDLIVDHEPFLALIKADRRQFEQVIMNLVVNARDAMPKGGAITLTTANLTLQEDYQESTDLVPAGDYVRIEVVDEGIGIPSGQLSLVFEPFFTTKRLGEGSGLGLSTAYGIVKQSGGYIFVESEEGSGAKFSVLFPQHEPEDQNTSTREAGNLNKLGTQIAKESVDATVLLVEDEASVRAFARRALELRGLSVIEADSGESALAMLAGIGAGVDLIVSNVVMPGVDGPTWVKQALKVLPPTPVIFVSGYAPDILESFDETLSNAAFLQKPFSLNDLAVAVFSALE